MKKITPSQTVGPFFHYMLTPGDYTTRPIFSNDLTTPGLEGQKIRIEGRVVDGDGNGIPDAMIEIWQADAHGRYDHAAGRPGNNTGFKGFGRHPTARDGSYAFSTVKPGRVAGVGGAAQAPHIGIALFARGMLNHVVTRLYFEDEASNGGDAVLALVPEDRRATLIAKRAAPGLYRFDIRIQEGPSGEPETVFFDA